MSHLVRDALIDAIKKRPAIWQTSHPDHKKKRVLDKLWEEILELAGSDTDTVQVVKARWKNLKDTFRKEIKKKESGSNWINFQRLSFLNDEMSYLTPSEEPVLLGSEDDEAPPCLQVRSPLNEDKKPSTSNASAEGTKCRDTRDTANSLRQKILELEQKKLEAYIANKKKNKVISRKNSEDYHYLMSLLPQMKGFSAPQKFRVRNKINNIMLEELENGLAEEVCEEVCEDIHIIKTEW